MAHGIESSLFNRLTQTLQRVTSVASRLHHLIDLGGGDITRVNAADTFAFQMDLEHDLGGSFAVLAKKLLDNVDDKFHGGEIVVEENDLKHLRGLDALGAAL